jgi:putative heme-binding domain-containing protein
VKLAAVVALRRLEHAGVAAFLSDADELVVTEAARAINDEGGIVAALPDLARLLGRPLRNEALVRRVLNANLRVGTPDAAGRVGAFATQPATGDDMKVEAIAVLGVWAAPSNLDRVDGAYLGELQARDAGPAQAAMTSLLPLLDAATTSPAVKVALIESASRLDMKNAAPRLLARLRQDPSADVRVAALASLRTLGAPEAEEGVRLAMEDGDAAVRMAAIRAMPEMPIPIAAKIRHLSAVIDQTSASVGERQSAVAALGDLQDPAVQQLLGSLFDRLAAGTLAAELQLDVLLAVRENGGEGLIGRLDRSKAGRTLENVAAVFPGALQAGGVASRGRQIATQHPAAQCTRCHSVGSTPGTVGPNLTGVGSRLSRAELLESLIDPNARIAPGFGSVSLTLTNGQRVDGLLREESDTAVVVEVAEQGSRRIQKSEIAQRTSAGSSMPPMGALLSPSEIRDVVEFLAGL